MATTGEIPPGDEGAEHRRAHQRIAALFNDLILSGEAVRGADGLWTINPGAVTILATSFFGQHAFLPGIPDGQGIMASRFYAQKVSYGLLG